MHYAVWILFYYFIDYPIVVPTRRCWKCERKRNWIISRIRSIVVMIWPIQKKAKNGRKHHFGNSKRKRQALFYFPVGKNQFL